MTINTDSTQTNQSDRVRQHTSSHVNHRIDEKITASVQHYANNPEDIPNRIQALEKEWDTERVLEANASILAFLGLILGITVNLNWFWLTGIVLPFLLQHAVQGWCLPLPVIRHLGIRTRNEIDQEKYALKALRGDFTQFDVTSDSAIAKSELALNAVKA